MKRQQDILSVFGRAEKVKVVTYFRMNIIIQNMLIVGVKKVKHLI